MRIPHPDGERADLLMFESVEKLSDDHRMVVFNSIATDMKLALTQFLSSIESFQYPSQLISAILASIKLPFVPQSTVDLAEIHLLRHRLASQIVSIDVQNDFSRGSYHPSVSIFSLLNIYLQLSSNESFDFDGKMLLSNYLDKLYAMIVLISTSYSSLCQWSHTELGNVCIGQAIESSFIMHYALFANDICRQLS